jgi:hypothetical protein
MRVHVKGEGTVTLTKADFVAQGGEGSIYAKGGTTYKIYTDPTRMIPMDKVRELQAIRASNVIKPEKLIVDKLGKPIGHTMRFIKDAVALCQLFPRTYRDRNGITPDTMIALVEKLRDSVQSVHDAGVLVVDLNEMNFLVDTSYTDLYCIDVNSYQTPHYPATALMLSVRDWSVQNNDWTAMSDWFSFAVVSFQMLVGIHPYKGKHPSLKGFEARMKANVSVFNPDVRVPKAAYPFDVIPSSMRAWYEAVLEHGKRVPPPSLLGGAPIMLPVIRLVQGTNNLNISDLYEFVGNVVGFIEHDGNTIAWTDQGVFIGNRRVHDAVSGVVTAAFSPKMGRPILAGRSRSTNLLRLFNPETRSEVPISIRADEVMGYRGTVYFRTGDKLMRLVLTDAGSNVVASTQVAGTCLPHATRLYEGVAMQNLLGRTYATIFPRPGATYPVAIEELDEYKIVEAKFDGGVLMVLGAKQGTYDRLVFRFNERYDSYDLRVVADVTPAGLNFVTLDTGVCVCMTEEDHLELFSARMGSAGMKQIEDPVLGADMRLLRRGGQIAFPRGNKVLGMAMR